MRFSILIGSFADDKKLIPLVIFKEINDVVVKKYKKVNKNKILEKENKIGRMNSDLLI